MAENAVIGAAAAAVVVVVCGAVQRRALRRFQTAPATAATTRARKREREREKYRHVTARPKDGKGKERVGEKAHWGLNCVKR